jgi:hypothetical protein
MPSFVGDLERPDPDIELLFRNLGFQLAQTKIPEFVCEGHDRIKCRSGCGTGVYNDASPPSSPFDHEQALTTLDEPDRLCGSSRKTAPT